MDKKLKTYINSCIMIYFILIAALLMVGCASIEKKKIQPPSVSTNQVIESLNETKEELVQAGESNTKVANSINKALSLAEKLDALLEQIEKEQAASQNKSIIKPIQ
jgi:uncharacterized protein YceK